MTKRRIFLAGDGNLFLSGLALVLQEEGFSIAGMESIPALLRSLATMRHPPELILGARVVDADDDLGLWAEVLKQFPSIPVVILAEQIDLFDLQRAREIGVRALLPTCLSPKALGLSLQLIGLGEDLLPLPSVGND